MIEYGSPQYKEIQITNFGATVLTDPFVAQHSQHRPLWLIWMQTILAVSTKQSCLEKPVALQIDVRVCDQFMWVHLKLVDLFDIIKVQIVVSSPGDNFENLYPTYQKLQSLLVLVSCKKHSTGTNHISKIHENPAASGRFMRDWSFRQALFHAGKDQLLKGWAHQVDWILAWCFCGWTKVLVIPYLAFHKEKNISDNNNRCRFPVRNEPCWIYYRRGR